MSEEIKKIMEDPDIIHAVLWKVNSNITLPDYHDLYSYFLTGHCNIYAQIITQIFEGVAIPYTDNGHVIVKIGDFFYDVDGIIIPNRSLDLKKYHEITIDELYDLPYMGVGAFPNEIDDQIIKDGVNAGRKHLEYLISKKTEQRGKSK